MGKPLVQLLDFLNGGRKTAIGRECLDSYVYELIDIRLEECGGEHGTVVDGGLNAPVIVRDSCGPR